MKTFVKKIETSESIISSIEKKAIDLKVKKQELYGKILEFATKNWNIILKDSKHG